MRKFSLLLCWGGTWGPISSCGFWTAGHSGGAQKPNTGDNSTGPVESQDNQRSSRVLEQKMCMEQPFVEHSGLCREEWLVAVWLVLLAL